MSDEAPQVANADSPRPWRAWVLAGLLVVGALFTRVVVDGRAELSRAELAEQEGSLELAVTHLGRAARWRAPLFDHDERALARLKAIGHGAEQAKSFDLALAAHRERRRALLATRTPFGVNDQAALDDANQRIASLLENSGGDRERAAAQLAAPTPGPTPGTWFASVLFLAWVGSMLVFCTRALDERGHLKAVVAARVGLLSTLLLVAWILLTRHPEWLA